MKHINIVRDLFIVGCFFLLISCSKDDKVACISCASENTPVFELCKESNGNASVNGEDTGVKYEVYLANLQETGVQCGG